MALIFAASSVPDEGDVDNVAHRILFLNPQLHNLLHVPAYALLTFLWIRTLSPLSRPPGRVLAVAFLIAVGYGALDEVHQAFVPGRLLSLTDASLNALGAGITVAATWLRR